MYYILEEIRKEKAAVFRVPQVGTWGTLKTAAV
jgi:hypothetical protein